MNKMTLTISQSTMSILATLLTTAYLTLMERKMLASTQARKGPNMVGAYGLLQPMADALKLMMKENTMPHNSNYLLFTMSPTMAMIMALTAWSMIPLDNKSPQSNINMGMMLIFALSSLNVYTMLLSGWSSNSSYALLGSIRATAQMMSYEMSMGMMMLTTMCLSSSLNLSLMTTAQQNMWYILPLFPAFTMFLMCSMAETNRTPFDLTESESELVSGFNMEYSAMLFTLLFLAEYINIMLMASVISIIFLGGSTMKTQSNPMILSSKMLMITYFFMWTRATFPRMRYDQLMNLLWKSYLPISLALMATSPSLMMMLTFQP